MNAGIKNGCDGQQNPTVMQTSFNDEISRPYINNSITCHLVEHGPDEGNAADLNKSTSADGRNFPGDWFLKHLLMMKPWSATGLFILKLVSTVSVFHAYFPTSTFPIRILKL
jgi:hypothetical protein